MGAYLDVLDGLLQHFLVSAIISLIHPENLSLIVSTTLPEVFLFLGAVVNKGLPVYYPASTKVFPASPASAWRL